MKEMGVSQGRPVLTPCLLFASPKTLGPMQVKHIHFVCSLKHLRGVIREKDDKKLKEGRGYIRFIMLCLPSLWILRTQSRFLSVTNSDLCNLLLCLTFS